MKEMKEERKDLKHEGSFYGEIRGNSNDTQVLNHGYWNEH